MPLDAAYPGFKIAQGLLFLEEMSRSMKGGKFVFKAKGVR